MDLKFYGQMFQESTYEKKCCIRFFRKTAGYKFSDTHPFNQKRLSLTVDLLKEMNALSISDIVAPRIATDEELSLAHDSSYIEIVKKASKDSGDSSIYEPYGIGTEDTPIFPNMHEASASLVGGTLTAVDDVMEGKATHALI